MGWSGGTFTRVHDWTTDEGSAIDIEASRMDAEDDNFASGINACIHKGGTNSPTANLPMGGYRHTGVDDAVDLDDYASAADVIDQHLAYYVDTGAADAYVITPSPAITAYTAGQRFVVKTINANTGASTINVNALGTKDIVTADGDNLQANMFEAGGHYELTYNGTKFVVTSPISLDYVFTNRTISTGPGLTGGGDLTVNRTHSLSHLGIESLTDPGADRIMFWDDSETASKWLSVGASLAIAGTTLNFGDFKQKSSQTDRNNTTTLADDPHLAGWSLATGTYLMLGVLSCSQPVNPGGGFKFNLEGTGGTYYWDLMAIGLDLNTDGDTFQAVSDAPTNDGNFSDWNHAVGYQIFVAGLVVVTSGPTTIDLQWAQQSSSANVTRLLGNSLVGFIGIP